MDTLPNDIYVLEELGLAKLPDAEKQEVLTDVMQNMLMRTYARIFEQLPEENRPLFMQLIEDGATVEAEELAVAYLGDIRELIKSACDEVLAEYKEPLER